MISQRLLVIGFAFGAAIAVPTFGRAQTTTPGDTGESVGQEPGGYEPGGVGPGGTAWHGPPPATLGLGRGGGPPSGASHAPDGNAGPPGGATLGIGGGPQRPPMQAPTAPQQGPQPNPNSGNPSIDSTNGGSCQIPSGSM